MSGEIKKFSPSSPRVISNHVTEWRAPSDWS